MVGDGPEAALQWVAKQVLDEEVDTLIMNISFEKSGSEGRRN